MTLHIEHPLWMILFLVLTAVTFSLFGFIIGIWADGFEKLQLIPLLVVTPLTFLGGSFYSISMLPPVWQVISLFNPVVYLVSGFRWSFFGTSDVEHLGEPRHDARLPRRVPGDRGVDLQDGVPAEELAVATCRFVSREKPTWCRRSGCRGLVRPPSYSGNPSMRAPSASLSTTARTMPTSCTTRSRNPGSNSSNRCATGSASSLRPASASDAA